MIKLLPFCKKISLNLLLLIFSPVFLTVAQTSNVIRVTGGEVPSREVIRVEVSVTNTDPFIAFQLDLQLPEQLSFVNSSAALDGGRSKDHSLSVQVIDGNILRIISYSLSNSAFAGNDGTVMSFQLLAGIQPGEYPLKPLNPIIAGTDGDNILTHANEGKVTILASDIQVDAGPVIFGEVPLNDFREMPVNVHNGGNLKLDISDVSFDSPYFELLGDKVFSLQPGTGRQLTVRFNSVVKGDYSQIMSISSNDPGKPVVPVVLEALAFAVNELHCGSMQSSSGYRDTLSLSINNMEPFFAFQFDLDLPEPLRYIDGSTFLSNRKTDHLVSANIINGNTLRVVAWSPSGQAFDQDEGDIVNLAFNVSGTGGWYSINLSSVIISDHTATNILSAYYNGTLEVAAPDIHCNASLSFGDVPVTDTASASLTIFNHGSDVLVIDRFQFTGNSFFTETVPPAEIAAGNHFELEISFHNPENGKYTENLLIYSNDPDENSFTVNLSAYSFSPNYMQVRKTSALMIDTVYIEILVDNHEPFVAFELNLHFPTQVMTFLEEETITHLSGREEDHVLNINLKEPGVVHMFAYSIQQKNFTGISGAVVQVGFIVDAPQPEIDYPLSLTGAILANAVGHNILRNTIDGALSIYEIVDVQALQETIPVKVYPIPAFQKIYIDFREMAGEVHQIMMFDAAGRVLITVSGTEIQPLHQLDVGHLVPGPYFLRIIAGEKVISKKVLIK